VQAGGVFVSGERKILDAFTKLYKTHFSFVASVRPEQLGVHLTDFDQF
jgi:hypothetical protein